MTRQQAESLGGQCTSVWSGERNYPSDVTSSGETMVPPMREIPEISADNGS
jgi:hypothetical protein